MRLRYALLYLTVALIVVAVLFTVSLSLFDNTGYGLTRLHDLGVSTI